MGEKQGGSKNNLLSGKERMPKGRRWMKGTFMHGDEEETQPAPQRSRPQGEVLRFWGVREKLVVLLVTVMVLPLLALGWHAWQQAQSLGETSRRLAETLASSTRDATFEISDAVVGDAVKSLDDRSRAAIERLTTDLAQYTADFLYGRDQDLLLLAALPRDRENYTDFINQRVKRLVQHGNYKLAANGALWERVTTPVREDETVTPVIHENDTEYHALAPSHIKWQMAPLYRELTFVGLDGRERLKVTSSPLMDKALKDVSKRENTFVKAESYFSELQKLKPGEIYVSSVIGAYRYSKVIGPYTKAVAEKRHMPFAPEESAFAGVENPVGKHFEGIVRWATPVAENGKVVGYVTMALDHRHLQNITDFVVPTDQRYTDMPDPSTGNYAFMLDQVGRTITHPRHYFIVGYDPETGRPVAPWLERDMYAAWQESGLPVDEFLASQEAFAAQSLTKRPALEQIKAGTLAADCRYLNFAPQCTGWYNLTKNGGSGSFQIYWSGLWKLNTAAAIPYFTGQYAKTPRGFGLITVGANVEEFHKAADDSRIKVAGLLHAFEVQALKQQNRALSRISEETEESAREMSIAGVVIIGLIVILALVLAALLSRRLRSTTTGMARFEAGDFDVRLPVESRDELGQMAQAFNSMAEAIQQRDGELRKFYEAVAQSPATVMITNEKGAVEFVNNRFTETSGYTAEEMMGKNPRILKSGRTTPEEYKDLWTTVTSGGTWRGEFHNRRKDGKLYWESASISPVRNEKGVITNFVAVKEEITWRKEQEALIQYQAYHDALTGLPNRVLAADRLEQAIKEARRTGERVAMVFIDLDDFKRVNDTMGHEMGDALLQEAANRLGEHLREVDTIARLGGDEFMVIRPDLARISTLETLCHDILESFSIPFKIGNTELVVSTSIGVAVYPDDAHNFSEMLRNSDTAMYAAKAAGRNTYRFFSESMNKVSRQLFEIEQHLRQAIDRKELSVHYQPINDAQTRRVVGAEALLRWNNPTLGNVSPADFIPVAEQTGLIEPIGDWVIEQVCRDINLLKAQQKWQDFRVAINVSPRQFRNLHFVERFQRILGQTGVQGDNLTLEITESFLIDDTQRAFKVLQTIKDMGVRISVDDFGTGYSSMSYIKRFPVDILKIDQSFIQDIGRDPEDEALVDGIVTFAKKLGVPVVAEGVEEERQLAYLQKIGCELIQGFYFSKPVPFSDFTKQL